MRRIRLASGVYGRGSMMAMLPPVVPSLTGIISGRPPSTAGLPGFVVGRPGVSPEGPAVGPGVPGFIPGGPGSVPGAPGFVPGGPRTNAGRPKAARKGSKTGFGGGGRHGCGFGWPCGAGVRWKWPQKAAAMPPAPPPWPPPAPLGRRHPPHFTRAPLQLIILATTLPTKMPTCARGQVNPRLGRVLCQLVKNILRGECQDAGKPD